MLVLNDRFRVLDELELAQVGALARCHDVAAWSDCAVFVMHVHDPREWSCAVDELRSAPTVRDTGWIASSELGWAVLDVAINKVATTMPAAFLADPVNRMSDLIAQAQSDA
jgi:hypothetical protein